MLELQQDPSWWASLVTDSLDAFPLGATGATLAAALAALLLVAPQVLSSRREAARPVSVPALAQAHPDWKPQPVTTPPRIDKVGSTDVIVAYCPATGSHLADVAADTVESINDKVERARVAQVAWRTSSWERRRRVLKTIRRWIVRDIDVLARTACRDTGKTVGATRLCGSTFD